MKDCNINLSASRMSSLTDLTSDKASILATEVPQKMGDTMFQRLMGEAYWVTKVLWSKRIFLSIAVRRGGWKEFIHCTDHMNENKFAPDGRESLFLEQQR